MEFRKITADDFNPFKSVDLLFYHPAYLEAQNYENPIAFAVYNRAKLAGAIVFNGDHGVATSLSKSPFGSLYTKDKLPHSILQQFLAYIKDALSQKGYRKIEMTLPASIYDHFVSTGSWQKEGFKIVSEEVNQHLMTTGAFEKGLHQMERRKLNRLSSGKIKFQMEPPSTDILTECHAFIAACRKDQGLEINISLEKLQALSARIDDRYDVYTARSGDSLVAVAITCWVDKDHMYYYLPATDYRYKKESPMVGLVKLIYEECSRRGIKYLDLGVSSVNGKLQQGLYDFKKRLGAFPTTKVSIYLEW